MIKCILIESKVIKNCQKEEKWDILHRLSFSLRREELRYQLKKQRLL